MGEEGLSKAQKRRLKRMIKKLEPYRRTGLILEIGPGRGWFLMMAREMGWNTIGVEINARAAMDLKKSGLEQIICAPIESADIGEATADIVRMWDVIEHLQDPRLALEKAWSALRPGGVIEISTTNYQSFSRMINGPDWVYLNGADHIYLFDPGTIRKILKRAGYNDIKIRSRSFNLRRKLYHPERELPPGPFLIKPFRKIIDELARFTSYGHQMIVRASKPYC
jgi:SAM-dependent methyltransferase